MKSRMKRSLKQRVFYLVLWTIGLMTAAAAGLDYSSTFTQSVLANGYPGGGSCCTYSNQCPGTQLCYVPSGGLAKCSMTDPNYCR